MKKIFRIILIAGLVFSSLKANAVILKNSDIKSAIEKQVAETYKKYTDADVSINVATLPFKDLNIPEGNVSYKIESFSNKFMARELEKVSLYVNGKYIKTFNAPIVAKAYENVLVAADFININQPITFENVTIKKIEVSNILDFPLKEEALGKEIIAKKAFRGGEVIDKRFVKAKPDVLRNANVTVIFSTNDDLSVSIEATALSDGIAGENVCLINKNYNKIYTGKVIGENKVLVKL